MYRPKVYFKDAGDAINYFTALSKKLNSMKRDGLIGNIMWEFTIGISEEDRFFVKLSFDKSDKKKVLEKINGVD